MSDYWFEEETLVTKFLWKTILRVIKIVIIHKSLLIDLNDEYLTWIADEVKTHYNIDLISLLR